MLTAEFIDDMQDLFTERIHSGSAAQSIIDADYRHYLEEMEQDGTWGTEQEIVAAAHLFNVSILCCMTYGNTGELCIQHIPPHFTTSRVCYPDCQHSSIYLVNLNQNHYDLAEVHRYPEE